MRQVLPYPLLSLLLLAMWLLLQQSLGLGHILLGSVIALLAGRAMAALEPVRPRVRNPHKILWLFILVIIDIIRSNLAVAMIVFQGKRREHKAGFLSVPLELRDRMGLTALACIVTATPGSAWLEYDPRHDRVLIHVLDVVDEAQWIDTLKNRYERLLLEIFQ